MMRFVTCCPRPVGSCHLCKGVDTLDDDEMSALLEAVCGHPPRGPSASSASNDARGAWSFVPGALGLGGFWVTSQLLSSPAAWNSAMTEASTEDSKAPRAGS
ncbi:hypothetical protein PAL_GLEAN10002629 [Pteropus alecto]|uniref:Uncharacterized protein n=1 Tax=Pteropus alecto TaxID=9402 RepID=L5KBZ1_PTEAL|nr:hypothetical protein PAL_GLEAN10002629 [Pteropus alecto]